MLGGERWELKHRWIPDTFWGNPTGSVGIPIPKIIATEENVKHQTISKHEIIVFFVIFTYYVWMPQIWGTGVQGYLIKTDRVSAYHSASAGHLSFFLPNKHGRDCGSSRCQLKKAEALQGKSPSASLVYRIFFSFLRKWKVSSFVSWHLVTLCSIVLAKRRHFCGALQSLGWQRSRVDLCPRSQGPLTLSEQGKEIDWSEGDTAL